MLRRLLIILTATTAILMLAAVLLPSRSPELAPADEGPNARPTEWFWQQRAYPHGAINPAGQRLALVDAAAKREEAVLRRLGGDKNGLDVVTWEQAGPTNIGARVTDLGSLDRDHGGIDTRHGPKCPEVEVAGRVGVGRCGQRSYDQKRGSCAEKVAAPAPAPSDREEAEEDQEESRAAPAAAAHLAAATPQGHHHRLELDRHDCDIQVILIEVDLESENIATFLFGNDLQVDAQLLAGR